MIALQLLVALVVLVTSDGVSSNGNMQCAYNQRKFCNYLLAAYRHNVYAIRDLVNDTFKDNRERLSNINSVIAEVLKVTNKSELFERLHEPMRQEDNALSELKVTCIVDGREIPECGDTLPAVSQAIYALAKATMEVADGHKKEAIKSACDKFMTDFRTEYLNKTVFELAHELGTAVENAF